MKIITLLLTLIHIDQKIPILTHFVLLSPLLTEGCWKVLKQKGDGLNGLNIHLTLFHGGGPCHIETSSLICSANQWIGFYMIGITVLKELIHPFFLLNLQLNITRGEFRLLQNHLHHHVFSCYFRHGVTKAFSFDKQNNNVRRVGSLIHFRSMLYSNRNQSIDLHCKPIEWFPQKSTIGLI